MSRKSENDVNTNLELQNQLASIQQNLSDIRQQTEHLIDKGIPGVQIAIPAGNQQKTRNSDQREH